MLGGPQAATFLRRRPAPCLPSCRRLDGEREREKSSALTRLSRRRARDAKAFARQGRIAEAERLAREAVTLAEGTDDINTHGDALMALAEVDRVGKRPSEAVPVIEQALELYERKGNVVSAGKARALLGEYRSRSEF